MHDIGKLLASDEGLNHQIVDTFATVAESDLSWTEKVWTSIARKDGALQIDFGLGKYPNRNVMDGFAGISRGREQWTVRAGRELLRDPETTAVGPIRYEVLKPLEKVRFVLGENDSLPLTFDVTFERTMPPFFEERHRQREDGGLRVVSDVVRYHQAGTVSGRVRIDGRDHEIRPDEWFAFRDHSWGIRLDVGQAPPDLRPRREHWGGEDLARTKFLLQWTPMLFRRPDGTTYELHYYLQMRGEGTFYFSGYLNRSDGSQEKVGRVRPELSFDDRTRRLRGGRVHFDMISGETRTVEVEVPGESGFHLGQGLYLGLDGRHHGGWRGALSVEGERIEDVTEPQTLRRIHQLRDCPLRVREGDAEGYGIFESVLVGEWKAAGLTQQASFL